MEIFGLILLVVVESLLYEIRLLLQFPIITANIPVTDKN